MWQSTPPAGPPPGFPLAGSGVPPPLGVAPQRNPNFHGPNSPFEQLAAAMVYNANITGEAVRQMAQQGQGMQQAVSALAQIMQSDVQRRGVNQGFRALKPKRDIATVTAETAKIYLLEEVQFGIDLGELGVSKLSEAGFRQLRACCTGRAKDTTELYPAHGEGARVLGLLEQASSDPSATQADRDRIGIWLVQQLCYQLERAVLLTPERRVRVVLEIDAEAVMHGDTAADAEAFLTKRRRGRYVLHVAGMINEPVQVLQGLRDAGVT